MRRGVDYIGAALIESYESSSYHCCQWRRRWLYKDPEDDHQNLHDLHQFFTYSVRYHYNFNRVIPSLGGARRVATDRRRGASAPPRTPPVYKPYCYYAAIISTDHNVTYSLDVDECVEVASTCQHGQCTNLRGSFICTCSHGYRLSPNRDTCTGHSPTHVCLSAWVERSSPSVCLSVCLSAASLKRKIPKCSNLVYGYPRSDMVLVLKGQKSRSRGQ